MYIFLFCCGLSHIFYDYGQIRAIVINYIVVSAIGGKTHKNGTNTKFYGKQTQLMRRNL